MSLANVLVEIDYQPGTQRIARLRGRFANFQPVMEGPVRELVRQAMIQQFRTRGGYGGRRWAPLKQSTLEIKRRLGVEQLGPLKRTRRLYQAATARQHPDQELKIGPREFIFNIKVPYASLHQKGTGRMVAREVVPETMPDEFMRQLRNTVKGFLVGVELGE